MTHRCGSSGMRVAKLSTIHLTVAMDMPRKPFEANTNTRRVMVKTSFEIVEQIFWSARNLPICAKSNRRIQFRPSMTHRCGSSGMRVAKLSTIHLTVAMDMPRKPFEANTNTRRVMVKTSFEIVEQSSDIPHFIPLRRPHSPPISLKSSGNLQGHERYCQVSCVSDAILSIIGKSRLIQFLTKNYYGTHYCHFAD